ncbi:hypothetical protein [Actinocorallia libanotica]|uniref:Nitrilase n=1 Tax=Actinocorallia libanotica TaxID=46162 RepID=A0ABP4BUH7_9ACTN
MSDTDGARFDDPAHKRAYAAYPDAAVELNGPELRSITTAVRDLGVFTYLGITERVRGTFHGRLADRISACGGGSAIAGPDGRWIVPPVCGQEQLVTADIDPATVRGERQNFDPTGHYARANVFRVEVDRRRHAPAVFRE